MVAHDRRLVAECLIGALFAWHPLHVESVAWISERKDVLSTCFALLTLLAYVRYAKGNDRRGYWLAVFGFALGLMSKPMLVTLPGVMLLLDFWPLQRRAICALPSHAFFRLCRLLGGGQRAVESLQAADLDTPAR